MDKRRLEAFVRLVELGSFRHAAGELNITQPALSQLIARTEKEAGIKLIDRSVRPITTTQAGKEFYFRSKKVLEGMKDIEDLMKDANAAKFGRVRVGFVPAMLFSSPTRTLRGFQQEFPDVEVTMQSSRTTDLIELLGEGAIDVAILLTVPDIKGVSSTELYSEEFMVCIPEGHPLIHQNVVEFRDLKNESIIHGPRTATPTSYDAIVVACTNAGFSPQFYMSQGSYLAQTGMVSAGMGVSFAPRSFSNLQPNNVEYRPLIKPKVGMSVTVNWIEGRLDEAGKALVRYFINECTEP